MQQNWLNVNAFGYVKIDNLHQKSNRKYCEKPHFTTIEYKHISYAWPKNVKSYLATQKPC